MTGEAYTNGLGIRGKDWISASCLPIFLKPMRAIAEVCEKQKDGKRLSNEQVYILTLAVLKQSGILYNQKVPAHIESLTPELCRRWWLKVRDASLFISGRENVWRDLMYPSGISNPEGGALRRFQLHENNKHYFNWEFVLESLCNYSQLMLAHNPALELLDELDSFAGLNQKELNNEMEINSILKKQEVLKYTFDDLLIFLQCLQDERTKAGKPKITKEVKGEIIKLFQRKDFLTHKQRELIRALKGEWHNFIEPEQGNYHHVIRLALAKVYVKLEYFLNIKLKEIDFTLEIPAELPAQTPVSINPSNFGVILEPTEVPAPTEKALQILALQQRIAALKKVKA